MSSVVQWLVEMAVIWTGNGSMASCEWSGCLDTATHTVDISFPDGTHETWQVCRAHDRTLKIQVVCGRPKAVPPAEPLPQQRVRCGACQRLLDEPASLPPADRQPCPDCGSLARAMEIDLFDTLTLHESLRIQTRPAGKGRWMTDVRTGDDYTRCLEGWGRRDLVMDRANDIYREAIVLHDGTSLESRARLSDHRG